jgi:hypothetical protein
MAKKKTSSSKNRKRRTSRAGRSNNGAKAAPPQPTGPQRVDLNAEQTIGVQLMSAREVIKQKNVFIARLQQKASKRAKEDSTRIADLEQEVTDLTDQLMQAWINAESVQNADLTTQLGLPQGTVNYQLGENGRYFYEQEAPAAPDLKVVPPADEDDDGYDDGDDEDEAEAADAGAEEPEPVAAQSE